MSSNFHIIYPGGNRSKLSIVEIPWGMSYELSDYAVASRRDFYSYADAAEYAKELARNNGLTFIPSHGDRESDYLD